MIGIVQPHVGAHFFYLKLLGMTICHSHSSGTSCAPPQWMKATPSLAVFVFGNLYAILFQPRLCVVQS